MSIFKSKFLLGVMIVAVMAVGAFAFAIPTTHASDCTITTTLKQGMSGADVTCLQSKLMVTPATGYFGTITKAAVVNFQNNNSLTADGIVGALTRAALMVEQVSTITTYPAGCTSALGFSSTTGLSCAGVPATTTTYPAGCTALTGFSTTTGMSCAVPSTLPAGCSSTAGYSSTTGALCSTGTTTGTLTGSAGSIDVNQISTDVEDVAIEGQATKMLGFKVEASDSDVSVTNLKVTLENTNAPTSPYRLTEYVDSVDIYMDSTKVGSADASDFSKSGYVYTKSITLSNAVVKMGASHKATFYVVINAAASIDTANMVGGTAGHLAQLDIDVDNVRYQDATGVIMTDGTNVHVTAPGTGSFDTLTNAGDVKLTISKGSSNPAEGTVQISDTGSTSDIKMLEFKLKATGDDLSFDQISFNVTSVMNTNTDPIADMIQGLEVRKGTDVLSSDPVFYNSDGPDTVEAANDDVTHVTFLLDDTYTISKDSTDTFTVYAKIADYSTFVAGSLKLSLMSTGIAPEDTTGDVVTQFAGSAVGNTQTFAANGVVIGDYNWAAVTSTGTALDFFFTVDNSAGDNNFDVVTNDILDALAAGNTGAIRTDSNVYETHTVAGVVTWYSGDAVTPIASTKYRVAVGDTATFRIRYSLGHNATTIISSADNGQMVGVLVNSVAGQTVPSTKVNSPTATVNL